MHKLPAPTALSASYTHSGPPPPLGHAAATQVLRIVQEALRNVEKHARANSVDVGSEVVEGEVRFWVRDVGIGFAPEAPPAAANSSGFGLLSLRERARLSGG